MKIYIAGKINGLKDYKKYFNEAETKLKEDGHICMNPSILPEGFPYVTYMPICTAMIDQCDAIYMLNNWKDSKGAKVELEYAKVTGKIILYQEMNINNVNDKYENDVINIDKTIINKTVTQQLEDLIDWLKGERYGYYRNNRCVIYGDLNDPINYDESKKQWELSRNRMIEKTINKIKELKGE